MIRNVSFLFLVLLTSNSYGQSLSRVDQNKSSITKTELTEKLDSLFSSYINDTPGVAVTVIENGEIVASKSYGIASLEFGIPFTHNTIVRLPYSESREFIAIAAVLMEKEGLLSLNDKIRKYFPNLPAWSEPVTIRHLLNNSSGFVDEWAVLLLTQASMENRFDVSQFLNLLNNQPVPGFEPGKGYMYSNSDYGLLRLILEKASQENLSVWMNRKIFEPLNMHSTSLHDNKDEVIAGFAHEYILYGNSKYIRWTSDKTSPGGNYYIATSTSDIEKWANLYTDPNSFASQALQTLKKDAVLMPGKGKNYVFGIKEYEEDGNIIISHQGVGGRTYLSRYPAEGYTIIVIGNTYANYVQMHRKIMNCLLGIHEEANLNKTFTPTPTMYTHADLQLLAGRYYDADTLGYESFTRYRKHLLQLIVHNDSLKMEIDNQTLVPLVQVAPYVFKDPDYEAYLEFVLPQDKNDAVRINTSFHSDNKVFHHIKDNSILWTPSKEELKSFEGKYYSPHLDFYWTLTVNNEGKLLIKRPTIADTKLTPETSDVFTLMVDKYPSSSFEVLVRFHRDWEGIITHFTVLAPRIMHLKFEKIQRSSNP